MVEHLKVLMVEHLKVRVYLLPHPISKPQQSSLLAHPYQSSLLKHPENGKIGAKSSKSSAPFILLIGWPLSNK